MKVIQGSCPIQGHLGCQAGNTTLFFIHFFFLLHCLTTSLTQPSSSILLFFFSGGLQTCWQWCQRSWRGYLGKLVPWGGAWNVRRKFAFMNGAMDFGTYKPQVSSYGGLGNREYTWGNGTSLASRGSSSAYLFFLLHYFLADYDGPVSEAGDCTLKYHLLRHLFSQYHCNDGRNTQAHAMTLHGRNLAHTFSIKAIETVLPVV